MQILRLLNKASSCSSAPRIVPCSHKPSTSKRINLLSYILASLQLISLIEQFLDTNETLYFMKSMDCIKAFREEAIQVSVLIHLLQQLQPLSQGRGTQHPTDKPRFWKAPFLLWIVQCAKQKWLNSPVIITSQEEWREWWPGSSFLRVSFLWH